MVQRHTIPEIWWHNHYIRSGENTIPELKKMSHGGIWVISGTEETAVPNAGL